MDNTATVALDTTVVTAMSTAYTGAIESLKDPVVGIMTAGIVLIVIFAAFAVGKKAFNKSKS